MGMAEGPHEIVGGIFFTTNELLRVEDLTLNTDPDFVDDNGFNI